MNDSMRRHNKKVDASSSFESSATSVQEFTPHQQHALMPEPISDREEHESDEGHNDNVFYTGGSAIEKKAAALKDSSYEVVEEKEDFEGFL